MCVIDIGGIARAGIGVERIYQRGSDLDGIPVNVARELEEIVVLIHQDGFITPSE